MAHVTEGRSLVADRRSRWFGAIYVVWIFVFAMLFFALRSAEDPSRPSGRILQNDAGKTAVAILQQRDPKRFRAWEAVHITYARRGEAGKENRWVVLCDAVPHAGLRDAVVVELRASDGTLIAIRKPVNQD